MLVRVGPSDYVVRMGWGGKLLGAGQGVSFWSWPWETYLRFPSTLQWMLFSASQVTLENQGVDVKGAFSWRVRDPLKAYQNLNMEPISAEEVRELLGSRSSEVERCANTDQGPLMRTTLLIRQLAESVTRNAIANMRLEETLRNRRSIIETLAQQIDAVVEPWGVSIASIEIVDIRVASKQVFANMQAAFRERLRQEATVLQIAADEEISQQKLASSGRVGQQEHARALAGVTLDEELSRRQLDSRQEVEKQRQQVDSALELEKTLADARLALEQAQADVRRDMAVLEADLDRRGKEHVKAHEWKHADLDLTARENDIMGQVNEAWRAQRMIDMLPRIVEGMKADKTTVFANSLPGASLEGLASTILSVVEMAGIKLASSGAK